LLLAGNDPEVVSVAERALGLAARELQDLMTADRHLLRAVRVADAAGLSERAGQARLSRCLVLAYRGRTAAALHEADRAARVLHGADAARLCAQRALLLQRLGRLDEALTGFRSALPALRRHGDELWEARVLVNRGLLHAYRGNLSMAAADQRRAGTLARALGQGLLAAMTEHNLGFVAALRADLPAALACYDRAEAAYRAIETPTSVLDMDRCEALLDAGLFAEARAAAQRAVDGLAGSANAVELAEARLVLGRAALADGCPESACSEAAAAAAIFTRAKRGPWAALARAVELQARVHTSSPQINAADRAGLLRMARRVADDLHASGWPVAALDARLAGVAVALAGDRPDLARADLLVASRFRGRGGAERRARAWRAEALLRAMDGDERRALSAARAGLAVLAEHRAGLGSAELRATVGVHGVELARMGVRVALRAGQARQVFVWVERQRAAGLGLPAPGPPDADFEALLVQLRSVAGQARDATLAGQPATRLLARQTALEQQLRLAGRHARGERSLDPVGPAGPRALLDALGGQGLGQSALLELVEVDSELYAVVLARGRASLHALGPARAAVAAMEQMRFALRRLARPGTSAPARAAAHQALAAAAGRVDSGLLGPVRARLGDGPVVIVPTGPLHSLPWSVLPTLAGRPSSVAPSAAAWLRARSVGRVGTRVVIAAGPELPGAAAEAQVVAAGYTAADCLRGEAATVSAVLTAADGADVLHVAAHGTFRTDNPLFSSLLLADGQLTVHDLCRLDRAPRLIVLSACDAALAEVHPGDEVLGLVSALLSLGAAAVIAPVVPVGDESTAAVMARLHEHLRAAAGPAAALATLVADPDLPPAERAVAGSLACLGAG
jgi:tetratricopeptide (TPR) repeat protein